MIAFLSPVTGRALHTDTPHSLADGLGERWPVVDGIAYLRVGSPGLAARALQALDRGDREAALLTLLAENDRWWDGAPPSPENLRTLVRQQHQRTLRQAMDLLGYGRVGTYFAHRWSDATFIAGLALLDAHWAEPRTAFELACGIGHYLRELDRLGVRTTGGDIVFSKLWLARHWVAGPGPDLVCFDADAPWPFDIKTDLAFCHDAFYFFQNKTEVAARLRATAADGLVALSHVHNRDWPNFSSGAAVSLYELQALFPGAVFYDDQVLTLAAASGGIPKVGSEPASGAGFASGAGLGQAEAFALALAPALSAHTKEARAAAGPLSRPPIGSRLRRNPLCQNGQPAWPSPRYGQEYGARATFACDQSLPGEALMAPKWAAAAMRRDLLDLPERW